MKLLVCGGRDYADATFLYRVLDAVHRKCVITQVIAGGQTGADTLAAMWARDSGVPLSEFRADWLRGKRAGPERNQRMLDEGKPNAAIAFPRATGEYGTGTTDMKERALAAGLQVWLPCEGCSL